MPSTVEQLRTAKAGEIAPIWRNGVTNTAIVIDYIRKKHAKKLRRNKAFAAFDRDLDLALEAWFRATREVSPKTYDQADEVFRGMADKIDRAIAAAKQSEVQDA